MKDKMKKLDNVEVHILKMKESSGNEQFYIRLIRTDENSHGSILEYDCFQTKHLEKKECLSRAWFSASVVARFAGLSSMEDIILTRMDIEEIEEMKKAFYLRW